MHTTAQATARVTIGYTISDRAANYMPMMDGYRPGADQSQLRLDVDLAALLAADADVEAIAEAVFVATNHPEPDRLTGLARAIVDAIPAAARQLRSLSVGDTVSFGDVRLACERSGWAAK